MKSMMQSPRFKYLLFALGLFIAGLFIFQAGIIVGYRKAAFSFNRGENYYRTFAGPGRRAMRGMPREKFSEAHGILGKIIKIELPSVIIESRDTIETVVAVSTSTVIRRLSEEITPDGLVPGDSIVVIGSPNDNSEVEAKFIRVLPANEQ